MVFKASDYWYEMVAKLMFKNGDLALTSDFWIVGLGSGFEVFPNLPGEVRDISGVSHTIKSYLISYRGVKATTIAIGGGPCYAEWVVAMAHRRRVKVLLGLGYCGALSPNLAIGDIVIPIAAIRDEATTSHFVNEKVPAIADYNLLKDVERKLREKGLSPQVGLIVTTSSTFSESKEWAERWYRLGVLGVDCETSIIYLLSHLCKIPAVNVLIVSDQVIKGKGPSREELKSLADKYKEVALTLLELLHEVSR